MNLHTLYIILEYFIFLPLDIILILFVFPNIIISTIKELKKAFFNQPNHNQPTKIIYSRSRKLYNSNHISVEPVKYYNSREKRYKIVK